MKSLPRDSCLDVLDTWLTFEALNPQALDEEDLRARGKDIVRLRERIVLPWTNQKFAKSGNEKAVFWIVYLTPIDLARAFKSILSLFPDIQAGERIQSGGEAPAAALVLDEKGCPVPDGVFLASFGWSYGKLREQKLSELPRFSEHEDEIIQKIGERITRFDKDQNLLPLERSDLTVTSEWLTKKLNLPPEELDLDPVCVRFRQYRENADPPEPELLNSFFIRDLLLVKEEVKKLEIGVALSRYLAITPPTRENDIVKEESLLKETLSPSRLPPSRWPSPGRHPLFMMQQAVVNHVAEQLNGDGIVAVNGPPGTGKTTLLRDVIAHVVLSRAKVLVRFENPSDAFKEGPAIKTGKGYSKAYLVAPNLIGHEIVVSSSNNKAVENITKELPSLAALAQDFEKPLRYFSSISDAIAKETTSTNSESTWGLFAAVLGNSDNRSKFLQTFWWDEDRSFASYLKAASGSRVQIKDKQTGEFKTPDVIVHENPPAGPIDAKKRWITARREFASALSKTNDLTAKAMSVSRALAELEVRKDEETSLAAELTIRFKKLKEAAIPIAESEARVDTAEQECEHLQAERNLFAAYKPGFFARLLNFKSYRDWHGQALSLAKRVDEAQANFRMVKAELEEVLKALSRARAEAEKVANRHTECEQEIASAMRIVETLCPGIGNNLPDREFWLRDVRELQMSSPWIFPELQDARDDLFVTAINLHRAFIDAAADKVLANLRLAVDYLKGESLSVDEEPYKRSVFATFFLVVPVVSSTFASFSRLFSSLKKAEIGWLLVDEAGQASPQQAVGALWRSQRAVIIGDPMQIEPVVTIPPQLINAICATFHVSPDRWAAPNASAQSLADFASETGTILSSSDGHRKIGIPLRVHRRCEEPMFSISNEVAYDGLMVYGTPPAVSKIGGLLGTSAWLHTEGDAQGKWSPAEGEVVLSLLETLTSNGIDLGDVYIISPFRQVAFKTQETVARSHLGSKLSSKWLKNHIGTVHTFQGKEAEAVIFVLGASGPQSVGARRWASGLPNLVNVAVTRAKRRLYVVGDHSAWSSHGYFKVVAECLPRRNWAGMDPRQKAI